MTYSEKVQQALLKASREIRKTACEVLSDCRNEVEFQGVTARWAILLAVKYAVKANEIEQQAYELACPVPQGTRAATTKSLLAYSEALAGFHSLLFAHREELPTIKAAEELTLSWIDADKALA